MKSYISFNIGIKERAYFVNYKNGTNNSYSDNNSNNNSNGDSNISSDSNNKGKSTKKIHI